MRIASVTITSNRREIIADAILSVRDWVDAAVVVDLGITDDTLQIVQRLMAEVGKPVYVTKCDAPTCGEWRNAGMRLAQDLGFDWAVTLDTDERLHVKAGWDIRKALEMVRDQADVIFARDSQDRYPKERIFKLPTQNWFAGHAHEAIPNIGQMVNLPGLTFSELPKSMEKIKANCEFIRREKLRELAEDDSTPRNWYYLGDALDVLGEAEEAIVAFQNCAERTTWDAEGAWANLRTALCARKLKDTKRALEYCARGLVYHPGYAELAWLAAVICAESGQWHHAIYWARMAMINGKPEIDIHHSSHCLPFGVWEGPYEILRDAYRNLGNQAEADKWALKADDIRGREVAA